MGLTRNSIIISGVIMAFILGSITTGTMTSAQQGGQGGLVSGIVDAINNLGAIIQGIEPITNVEVNVPPAEVQVVGLEGQQGPVGEQGPQGDKGDKGDTGPQGEQGEPFPISAYVIFDRATSAGSGDVVTASIDCDTGDVVTTLDRHGSFGQVNILRKVFTPHDVEEVPVGTPTGGEITFRSVDSGTRALDFFIICLDNPPFRD